MTSNYKTTHILTIEPEMFWSGRSSSSPIDVEFDIDGNILICNSTDEILKFNEDGKFLSRLSIGYDRKICGISCNENGEIYMTDDKAKEVIVCDDEGQITFNFPVNGKSSDYEPNTMTLGGLVVSKEDGMVFVVDQESNHVLRFSKDAKLLNEISYGSNHGKGTIRSAQYVALDASYNVLVNDSQQNRVQVFRPDGQFVRSLRGSRHPGTSLEYFNQPSGIAVFENGHVAVGCQSGLFACKNTSYGPIVRRFDDKNSANGILGTKGIAATKGNTMAVALAMQDAESTIELFKYDLAVKEETEC
ncbi:E3 ubiquitin-protein ligase TRIM71-like [Anneissia japonica]|uniref:E3 ubiquitin-protein ligase TRIM71-like n=1 Tax=Anneissia japonica TaxID=1529436 RepID=UPI0014257A24|nr:E3 ubiquitin-protein ligase TRIM71-like [Anneissia japonica]